jgi:8-oxo-dGTP diphosphatase
VNTRTQRRPAARESRLSADRPLYERDPQAWNDYLAEGNAQQPRKRVAADVIVRNTAKQILLVDPNYKPDWDLPGGMAEANEPPAAAARREFEEELGIPIDIERLVCVDWVSPHGPWDDLLMFVFDGGTLPEQTIADIRLADDELGSFSFVDENDAAQLLRPYVWRRTEAALHALQTGTVAYLHDGLPANGVISKN